MVTVYIQQCEWCVVDYYYNHHNIFVSYIHLSSHASETKMLDFLLKHFDSATMAETLILTYHSDFLVVDI